MKNRKKDKVGKDTILEYIYEYGIDKASELLNIPVQEIESIIDEGTDNWQKPHINKNIKIEHLNPEICKFVESNYQELYDKYVKNIDKSIFWQNDEDIFHTSLIQLCNNNPESDLFKLFDRIFKVNKWELHKRNNQMRIKEKAMRYKFLNEDKQIDLTDIY